jgi:hypothetical protein
LFFPDECREHPHHDDDHGNDCHSADDAADAGDQLVPRPRVHGCVQLKKRKLTVVFAKADWLLTIFQGCQQCPRKNSQNSRFSPTNTQNFFFRKSPKIPQNIDIFHKIVFANKVVGSDSANFT